MKKIANRTPGFAFGILMLMSAGFIAASSHAASEFNLLGSANEPFTVKLNAQLGQPPQAPVPSITINGTQYPATGYQGGALVTGLDGVNQVLYAPWQVQAGGGTIASGLPHGVALAYNAAVQGFTSAANFNWFDLNSQNGIAFTGPAGSAAQAYNYILVVGHTAYYCPAAVNQKPVFVAYDFQHDATAQQSFLDPASYSYWPAPAPGGKLGRGYGWCGMAFDGRFIYYAPTVSNGNAVRYDTTKAFSDSTAWSAFNMTTVSTHAYGFNSMSYDGHRYVYYPPNVDTYLVKFDTWNGGSALDPAAFANPAAYSVMDMTQLGAAGYPVWTGGGSVPANPQNLTGYNGAPIVFNQSGSKQYMYFVPWKTQSIDVSNTLLVNSTFARVQVGSVSGGAWQPVDPFTNAGAWQLYDLSNLTNCPNWTGPTTQTVGGVANQSVLGGYQLSWVNTRYAAPRVGFCASAATWWSQHAVDADLYDPTGWYIAPVSPLEGTWVFGGAYDPVNDIFYGSSPFGGDGVPLVQTAFSGAGAPPAITTQPSNATVNLGQTATFSVTSSGGAPLSYQWTKNGATISGATAASYTTPATVAGDSGALFAVIVSNVAGSVASSNATLTVISPPTITSPASAEPNPATVGQTIAFSVAASDPDGYALSYAWTFGDGGTAAGASASYAYAAAGSYTATVAVSDNYGNTVSSSVTVTVNAPAPTLHVAAIGMSLSTARTGKAASATVTIQDGNGATVNGATVSGTWSGLTSGTVSANTGSAGTVKFTSARTKKAGTFTFTVTNIAKAGYTYASNQNVVASGSITTSGAFTAALPGSAAASASGAVSLGSIQMKQSFKLALPLPVDIPVAGARGTGRKLPAGVRVSGAYIAGKPTYAGTYTFTIQFRASTTAEDTNGASMPATVQSEQQYTLTVMP